MISRRGLLTGAAAAGLILPADAQTYRPGFGFSRPGFQFLGGGAGAGLRPQDVFATSLYTGTSTAQTITNGLDLAGKGGLVWEKDRPGTYSHGLVDTVTGAGQLLDSASTSAQSAFAPGITAFNSTGFTLGTSGYFNNSGGSKVAWSFRRAAKFFDVVTYTGDGTSARQIAHGLGVAPGMIVVKSRSLVVNWPIYHRSLAAGQGLFLNTTDASSSGAITAADASTFTVANFGSSNQSGATYVAYLFAHDPDTTNGVIQCGTYTEPASGSAQFNLGWQPQFIIVKPSAVSGSWYIQDAARGTVVLSPNTSSAENSFGIVSLNATGFSATNGTLGGGGTATQAVYCAIRAPV